MFCGFRFVIWSAVKSLYFVSNFCAVDLPVLPDNLNAFSRASMYFFLSMLPSLSSVSRLYAPASASPKCSFRNLSCESCPN